MKRNLMLLMTFAFSMSAWSVYSQPPFPAVEPAIEVHVTNPTSHPIYDVRMDGWDDRNGDGSITEADGYNPIKRFLAGMIEPHATIVFYTKPLLGAEIIGYYLDSTGGMPPTAESDRLESPEAPDVPGPGDPRGSGEPQPRLVTVQMKWTGTIQPTPRKKPFGRPTVLNVVLVPSD